MELFFLLIFLSVPLIIIGYVIINARHYGWFSFIGIIVIATIGMTVVVPIIDEFFSGTNGNASGNISKMLDDISSSDAMKNFFTVVPVIIIGFVAIFLVWLGFKALVRFTDGLDKKKDKRIYSEGKEKQREASKYIDIKVKSMKVDGMKQKEKNKEVVTSGWSEKK